MMADAPDSIVLTGRPLDLNAAFAAVRDERAGAVDLFVGTTRRFTDERETLTLSYEAYEAMVAPQIRRILERARERWDILRCVVHHRTGSVAVGEPSVIIGVSTRHRAEAFEACRYLIDTLKGEAPIWKQETYADGTTEWIEGGTPGNSP